MEHMCFLEWPRNFYVPDGVGIYIYMFIYKSEAGRLWILVFFIGDARKVHLLERQKRKQNMEVSKLRKAGMSSFSGRCFPFILIPSQYPCTGNQQRINSRTDTYTHLRVCIYSSSIVHIVLSDMVAFHKTSLCVVCGFRMASLCGQFHE